MHYVKGSLGTRLEVPAKSLQAPVGGVSETCTASWVPGAPSPRATGKEALGSCRNLGLSWPGSPSGPRRACRARGGHGASGLRGDSQLSPALYLGQRGIPGPTSGYLVRQGCLKPRAYPSCGMSTPSSLSWTPRELFQALGGDITRLARRGKAPTHWALTARRPGPAYHSDSRPPLGHQPSQCRAAQG